MSAEDGFGIIEVLISALLVVIISVGVLAAVDAAGRTSATNKARGDASNLASQDQDRLRSLTIPQLLGADGNRSAEPTVDRRKYTVTSQGAYVIGGGGSDDCASTDEAPRYVRMSSTVTWPGMTVKPIEQDSLRAIPNRSLEGSGSLAVDINNASGGGVEGTTVTITSTSTTKVGTTNAKGCVIFGFIPTGTYAVSFNRAPYINADNPGETAISATAVVAENAIASKSYLYDQPGSLGVTYKVSDWNSTTAGLIDVPGGGDGFMVASGEWGLANTRPFPHGASPTANTGSVLFPFTSGYSAWAGKCASNQPPSLLGSGIPTAGGSASAQVREFRVRIRVRRRNSSSTSSTTNYSTTSAGGTGSGSTSNPVTRVLVKPTDSSCTSAVDATHQGSAGSGASAVSTWEAIIPFGSYSVCAHYWTGTASNARAAITQNNLTWTGVSSITLPATNQWITIPWPTTTPAPARACT